MEDNRERNLWENIPEAPAFEESAPVWESRAPEPEKYVPAWDSGIPESEKSIPACEEETGADHIDWPMEELIKAPLPSEQESVFEQLILEGGEAEKQDLPKPEKKHTNFRRGLVAACLVAVLGGSSIGMGLGVGRGIAENYFASKSSSTASEASSFTFTSVASPVSSNIMLASSNQNIAQVVGEVSDAVVSINLTGEVQRTWLSSYEPQMAGSGIIFSEDDDKVYVVTNYHVVDNGNNKVTKVTVSIDDEKQASAGYVGGDSQADVAVISVNKADLKEAGIIDYKIAAFGDSDNVQIGETVVAIGNALGEGKTATMGIVSAIKKQTAVKERTLDLIQTDAAINEGNSGGPLVNTSGQVLGMNTAKLAGNGVEGMGYSIPANTVKKIADELLANGSVDRPYLGVGVSNVTEDMVKMYDLPSLGVLVEKIYSGSAAEAAGIQSSDIIVGFGDTKVTTVEDLTSAIAACKSGDMVKVYIYRGGKTPMVLDVTLTNMNAKF